MKIKASFFYTDNRMVASTNSWWIETAFDMLTGIFDWVGLKKNVKKIMGMMCHPHWR